MLETSFGLIFFLRKPRPENAEGTHYLYCRITVDGHAKEFSLKHLWHPSRWNIRLGRPNGNKEDARALNAYIDSITAKIYEAKKSLIDDRKSVSAISIFNIIHGKRGDKKTILAVFKHHNDQMSALIGSEFAPGTLERYATSLDHTRSFIKWKYKQDDIEIDLLDYDFISQYEFWFKSVRKCSHNTTMKYLANFKKIVLICIKQGWLTRDPFHAFKMTKREVDREALTDTELKKIRNKDFGNGRLSQVRDIFLFCCYTGLAYADVHKLRRMEIIEGMDGGKWITTTRKKTDSSSRIPILPVAQEIMDKYQDHPQCESEGRVLPVLTNQKMNSYLKEIADLTGIQKNITFHLARHTFATTVTLTNGVPIESVSKMLGHRNIKTTQQYAKIVDKKVSDDMARLRDILNR
ncbi:site-specific integrase [Dyadobacter luteus]|uniref:Site-specific integrase n=1 Tax=Dyadobacter luteus TaxID=2259619 RepID=A0A3D8YFK8_9BACT|nr:site-specific integrase [Dyadobacter luteus]REA63447.1 site-specific integrase [Dyadobacter luteus]